MGIRVKKMIGYGIQNLKLNPSGKRRRVVPADPRWDYEKYLSDWCTTGGDGDPNKEQNLQDYTSWCERERGRLVDIIAQEKGIPPERARVDHTLMLLSLRDRLEARALWTAPYAALEWGHEHSLPEVLLFIPPEHRHEWYRHDNIIDYVEEQSVEGCNDRFTHIQHSAGIYPYNGKMRRVRKPTVQARLQLEEVWNIVATHERFNGGTPQSTAKETVFLQGGTYNRLVGQWSPTIPSLVGKAAKRHLLRDWRPVLPPGVLALVEYLGCFPDAHGPNGICADLRPVIFVIWS